MNDYTSDITYFARLLEFVAGSLTILLVAVTVLLVMNIYKNNRKNRLIRSFQQQMEALQSEQKQNISGTHSSLQTADGEKISSPCIGDRWEKEKAVLEKELSVLQQKLIQEQNARKQMEDEIARLLDQIKKITLLP